MSNDLVKCLDCNGRGYSEGFLSGDVAHYYGRINCLTCNCTGLIEQEQAAQMLFAGRMAEDRRRRHVTTREEAKRLGVDWPEWTRIEHYGVAETKAGRQAIEQRKKELCGNDTF